MVRDGECINSFIPGCEILNPARSTLCEKCFDGFGISYDKTSCHDCSNIDIACEVCESRYGMPFQCTQCSFPTINVNGTCQFPNCAEWIRDQNGDIQCIGCQERYSLWNNSCVECVGSQPENKEFWLDCNKCLIDNNGIPWDCLSCVQNEEGPSKIIYKDGPTTPNAFCQYQIVQDCVEMIPNDPGCQTCAAGFANNYTTCDFCEIDKCDRCSELPYFEDAYTCDQCLPPYVQYDADLFDSGVIIQVCDWANRIVNCEISDLNNQSNCLKCNDGFYFNNLTSTCDPCSNVLPHCDICINDGSECEDCSVGFHIAAGAQCYEDNCSVYKNGTTDFCLQCDEGFYMVTNTGICTDSCGGWNLYQDEGNMVCREICPPNMYYDINDPTNCLPCNLVEDAYQNFTYCVNC